MGKCLANPYYFLKTYGTINDADLGTISWNPDWRHFEGVLSILCDNRLVIILKARQIGMTWLMAGYGLWKAIFHEGANVIIVSKKEEAANETLSYCKFIWEHLPDFMRPKIGRDQASYLTFPMTHSRVRSLPTTKDAGLGFGGASLLILDEWDFHEFATENYTQIKPMIDAGGGRQLVILSAPNKWEDKTKFKEIYHRAMVGEGGFHRKFLPYDVVPYRDEEWRREKGEEYADWELEALYPRTEAEALKTLESRQMFGNLDVIFDFQSPLKHDLSDKYGDIVKIYRLPVVGRNYCQFADPSDGKDDPHAIIVMDAVTGEEVAESHGKTPADLCAQIHDDLVRLYGAFNSYELNARAGGLFSAKLRDLDTPKQAPFLKTDGKLNREKTGWWTSATSKDTMVWGLEEAVRLAQIRIHSKECYEELGKYLIPEGGKPQAATGAHDDYVDAWMRVWKLKEYVPTGKMTVTTIRMREG